MDQPEIEFIYIGDTMCSWCWGFAPTLDQLSSHYAVPMRLINGGLRPGPNAQKLDADLRGYLLHHWEQVAAASGQAFNEAALPDDGWLYDTEYPARAVVTMRRKSPENEWDWFKRLQSAFYAEAVDITSPAAYPDLLAGYPVDEESFMADLGDEQSRMAAWDDFGEAQALQAHGFPTLLLRTGRAYGTVTRGYMPFDAIEPHLTAYLADRYAAADYLS